MAARQGLKSVLSQTQLFSVWGGYVDVIMYFWFVCVLFPVKSSLRLTTFGATYSQLLKLKFSLPPKVRSKSPFIPMFNIQAWDEMKMSLSWRPWRDEQWRVALPRNIYSSVSNSDAPSPSPHPLRPSPHTLQSTEKNQKTKKNMFMSLA